MTGFNEDNITQMADSSHGDNLRAFERGFAEAFIGYAIGHYLDQTRFGRWFNTNPVVTAIVRLMQIGLILFAIFAICDFAYRVATL